MTSAALPFLDGRILVVDDEDNSRQALCRLLQGQGYACAAAPNGAEAIKLVGTFRPQAIIMDLMMPVLDGFETARRLKAGNETRAIPVLALTGSTTVEDRRRAAQAGVDRFLAKPVDFDQLLTNLRSVLTR